MFVRLKTGIPCYSDSLPREFFANRSGATILFPGEPTAVSLELMKLFVVWHSNIVDIVDKDGNVVDLRDKDGNINYEALECEEIKAKEIDFGGKLAKSKSLKTNVDASVVKDLIYKVEEKPSE